MIMPALFRNRILAFYPSIDPITHIGNPFESIVDKNFRCHRATVACGTVYQNIADVYILTVRPRVFAVPEQESVKRFLYDHYQIPHVYGHPAAEGSDFEKFGSLPGIELLVMRLFVFNDLDMAGDTAQ